MEGTLGAIAQSSISTIILESEVRPESERYRLIELRNPHASTHFEAVVTPAQLSLGVGACRSNVARPVSEQR
jgi:hypothetical protein